MSDRSIVQKVELGQDGCLTKIRKAILEAILIFLLLAIGVLLYRQNSEKIILVPFATMPESLGKKGLTGEVFSRNLIEKIEALKVKLKDMDVDLISLKKKEEWKDFRQMSMSDFDYQVDWHSNEGLTITTQLFRLSSSSNMFRLNSSTFARLDSEVFLLDDGMVTITFRVTKSPLKGHIPALRIGPLNPDEIDGDVYERGAIYALRYIDPFSVSELHISEKRLKEAEQVAHLAAKFFPESFQAQAFYARTLEKCGKLNEAAEAFRESYDKNTNCKTCLDRASFLYVKAINELDTDERQMNQVLPRALDTVKTYVDRWPDSSRAYNMFGIALEEGGNIDRALKAYKMALLRNKDHVYPLENLMWLYIKTNMEEEGLIWLEESELFDKTEHAFWCSKAHLEYMLGKTSMSRVSAEIALGIESPKSNCCTALNKIILD